MLETGSFEDWYGGSVWKTVLEGGSKRISKLIGDKDFHFACWENPFLSLPLPDFDQETFYSLSCFLFCHWITSLLHLFMFTGLFCSKSYNQFCLKLVSLILMKLSLYTSFFPIPINDLWFQQLALNPAQIFQSKRR